MNSRFATKPNEAHTTTLLPNWKPVVARRVKIYSLEITTLVQSDCVFSFQEL